MDYSIQSSVMCQNTQLGYWCQYDKDIPIWKTEHWNINTEVPKSPIWAWHVALKVV